MAETEACTSLYVAPAEDMLGLLKLWQPESARGVGGGGGRSGKERLFGLQHEPVVCERNTEFL